MTPAALRLLRLCATRNAVIQSMDPEWEGAQQLIAMGLASINWTMRGGYAGLAITEAGRAVTSNAT